jgi:N-acetylglutamate synthase-like GNAT family acetyltransferase
MTTIRSAHPGDILSLTALTIQLGYAAEEKQIEIRFNRILQEREHQVWVAITENKVSGWVHAFITHRIESDSFVEIGGLVVDDRKRGNGIGQQLVAAVHQWAIQTKHSKVRVRSNVLRQQAHSFYQKMGYELNKEQKVFDFVIS